MAAVNRRGTTFDSPVAPAVRSAPQPRTGAMLSVKGDEHRYPDIGELTYWRNERPTARTEKATRSSLVPLREGRDHHHQQCLPNASHNVRGTDGRQAGRTPGPARGPEARSRDSERHRAGLDVDVVLDFIPVQQSAEPQPPNDT